MKSIRILAGVLVLFGPLMVGIGAYLVFRPESTPPIVKNNMPSPSSNVIKSGVMPVNVPFTEIGPNDEPGKDGLGYKDNDGSWSFSVIQLTGK